MIASFDLDDTLYPEISYVHSGFRAVARWLETHHHVDPSTSFDVMVDSMRDHGRGRQFDHVLDHWGLLTRRAVRDLVRVYRAHDPEIVLPSSSREVLESVGQRWPMYLVTDGNHRVQARKVEALGIAPLFRHCYFTYRYGRDAEKPSTKTFALMLQREGRSAGSLVYVGDNPHKDFVGVRELGGRTIRVLTGSHRAVVAEPGYDADVTVDDIGQVPAVLETFAG